MFTRPPDKTIYTDANCAYNITVGNVGDVTNESDNCSTGIQATYKDADPVAIAGCEGGFTIARTWSLVDNCGNKAADQVQTITIRDNTAPTFNRPNDITIYRAPDGTYDASPTYTGDVTDEHDNCSTGIQATYADVVNNSDPNNVIITRTWSLVDNCGNHAANQVQKITVIMRTTDLDYVGNTPVQYSDNAVLSATLTDVSGTTPAPISGKTITFNIGTQYATAVTNALGVATATIKLNQDPAGTYTVTYDFAGDGGYAPYHNSEPFDITQENARISYTGDLMKATESSSTTTVNVTLRANIMDITAVDPAHDPSAGDIRNAQVKFVNRDTGSDISGWIPVSTLLDAADPKTGTVSCNLTIDLGSSPYAFTTVGIIVGQEGSHGYYLRDAAEDNVVVTVYLPSGDFITGGGYITANSSCGSMAADAGSKIHFGFHVKFNKVGTNLQGNLNFIFSRTESDGVLHTYQVKANAMQSLGVDNSNPQMQTAEYVSKSNLTDITNPLAPVSMGGNLMLYVKMTDYGEPGTNDKMSFVLVRGNDDPTVPSNILISSNCVNNTTTQINLSGGNLVVHAGFDSGTYVVVTSDINPSDVGVNVTFTATVTGGTDGKLVTFKDGTVTLGSPVALAGGIATYTTNALSVGSHSITAVYDGGIATSAPLVQEVTGVLVTLSSSKNPSVMGDVVTFTATVTGGEDTKTVTFYDDGDAIGSPVILVGGIAAIPAGSLTVGTHTITAVYNGTVPVTSPTLTQVVQNVTVTLTSSKNPSLLGDVVTFTATVSGNPDGKTVTFYDGGVQLDLPVTVSGGKATLTPSTTLSAGTHNITAVFDGMVTSDVLAQVVNSGVMVTLTSSKNPSSVTEPVTFTATVTGGADGKYVTFKEGATTIGSSVIVSLGKATINTTFNTTGSHSITAIYDGGVATSPALIQLVNPLTLTLTSSKNPATTKTNVTFTATVSGTGGYYPTSGQITFTIKRLLPLPEAVIATPPAVNLSGGKASTTYKFAANGTYLVTAVYNVTGQSATFTQTIANIKSAAIPDETTVQADEVVCDVVVPNGFSPNGDGINDYFQVTCLGKYPDAVLKVYSGTGALVYEQAHYGNLDFWGSEDAAWWDGSKGKGEDKVSSGTYIYVIDLNHAKKESILKGYVFISK